MESMNGEPTALLALLFKIIKIFIYFFFQLLFLRRAVKKWDDQEPVTVEVYTFAFFFCMLLGSLSEVIWLESDYLFYQEVGASYIYFIGFIALSFLSIGIERSANLKSKGLIALVPLSMAIITLLKGTEFLHLPYYFIALIVAIIPGLYLYQAFQSEGLIRKQFLYVGVGYFLVFAGEALNYNIILINFPWLDAAFVNLTGVHIDFLPPLLILVGLLCLLNGYVRLAKKLTI